MTWAKFGSEFFAQLMDKDFAPDLEDAAQLTHVQALFHMYQAETMELTFKKKFLRQFATSDKAAAAVQELVRLGLWADIGDRYKIIHHEDVVRQSLGYQLKERNRAKNSMRKKRQRDKDQQQAQGQQVTQDVTRNDTQNVMRTQSVSQSFSHDNEVQQNQNFDSKTGEVFDPASDPWNTSDPWGNQDSSSDPVAEFYRQAGRS